MAMGGSPLVDSATKAPILGDDLPLGAGGPRDSDVGSTEWWVGWINRTDQGADEHAIDIEQDGGAVGSDLQRVIDVGGHVMTEEAVESPVDVVIVQKLAVRREGFRCTGSRRGIRAGCRSRPGDRG